MTRFISYIKPVCQEWKKWLFYLRHRNQHRELRIMKKQGTMFQTKEQDKSPETNLNKIEMSDLPDREFKIMVMKMFTEVRRAMSEQSENFNKQTENIKKYKQKS